MERGDFLMFSLDRRDIFPADDLALQVALEGFVARSQANGWGKPEAH